MRRKCYTLWMIVVICLLATVQPAFASGTPQVSASASAASVSKGETVNVAINLKNNPKISTFGVTLIYNSNEFQYKDCNWSSTLGVNDMKMVSDEDGNVNLSLVCDQSYEAEGAIATIVFQAKKDVAAVNMTLQLREMADANLSDVGKYTLIKEIRVPVEEKKETGVKQNKDGKNDEKSKKEELKKVEASKQTEILKKEENQKSQVKSVSSKETTSKAVTESKTGTKTGMGSAASSAKLDENYKTGVAVGADILFVIAAICGLGAFISWNEQKKER